jgi:hypothetical protein
MGFNFQSFKKKIPSNLTELNEFIKGNFGPQGERYQFDNNFAWGKNNNQKYFYTITNKLNDENLTRTTDNKKHAYKELIDSFKPQNADLFASKPITGKDDNINSQRDTSQELNPQSDITQIEEKNKMVNNNKKQLFFKATTEEIITLTINMNETTVGEVKELVAKKMNTTADRIRLIAGSNLLIDNNALMPNEHDNIRVFHKLCV